MQVVGYDTRSDEDVEPALLVARDGVVSREPLAPGTELAYSLGERRCAGAIDGDSHTACPNPSAPYCEVHRSRWACARCTGDCSLPLDACRQEHAVYLAAFAPDTFKVGVTRSWRLRTRLREQGADRAAHIRTVRDGRVARTLEAEIATELTDRVQVPRKIQTLHQSVDEESWNALLADYEVLETFDFDYGFSLTARPVAETMGAGTVVGTKGRVLVLSRAASTYAVDLRDLVGYELDEGTDDRDLQVNLGSFN